MNKLFQTVQNIDHLTGNYVVSALVIARDPESAHHKLALHLLRSFDDDDDRPKFHAPRMRIREFGVTSRRRLPEIGLNKTGASEGGVIAFTSGSDCDLG